MRYGRVGGALFVAGCVLFAVAGAMNLYGGDPDSGLRDVGDMVRNASLALIGCGAVVLGVAGPRPLHGLGVRAGLGVLVVGLVGIAMALNTPVPAGTDVLESGAIIIGGIGGLLGIAIGMLVIGLSLVRLPGPSRVAGALVLVGLALVPLTGGVSGVLLGGIGLGVLAMYGDRSAVASA